VGWRGDGARIARQRKKGKAGDDRAGEARGRAARARIKLNEVVTRMLGCSRDRYDTHTNREYVFLDADKSVVHSKLLIGLTKTLISF
jgi:hypothetical protein